MNDVYFICLTCKNYHDAGYRWCYVHLERPGIISRNQAVNVEAVFGATEYWQAEQRPEEEFWWLRRDLPSIRRFLETHRNHDLIYGEAESYLWSEDKLDWMDEGVIEIADRTLRFYIERLGFTKWEQVEDHIKQDDSGLDPMWYLFDVPEGKTIQQKFEELVRERL